MKVDAMKTASYRALRHARRRRRARKNGTEGKRKFTRDELLAYVRSHNFRSVRKLEAGRKPGEPRAYDLIKEFGKWENAKTTAFGMDINLAADAEYLPKSVLLFNLWTYRAYLAKRKMAPDVIPSMWQVRRKWGFYRNLVNAAIQISVKETMDAYKVLWRRYGRKPTIEEIREAGLYLDSAIKFYGSRKELDKAMEELEKVNARKTGSS